MKLLVILFLLSTISLGALSQVNTEALMRGTVLGFGTRLGVNFGFNSGNSTFFRWQLDARSDYRAKEFYTFLVGNLERGTANDAIFLFRGFVHYRAIWQRDTLLQPEFFVQREFNEFILLKDRVLFGSGIRLNLLYLQPTDTVMAFKLTLGIGAMWENERFTELNPETKLLRSTNYIALLWRIVPRTSLQLIGYYQVDVKRPSDYRLLLDGLLTISITDKLAATVVLIYRYDNEPVLNVARFDLDLRNGFTYTF
ncbi:MAG: DUF481 domain-containing protein [Chloroherpetonaceae bacterium]